MRNVVSFTFLLFMFSAIALGCNPAYSQVHTIAGEVRDRQTSQQIPYVHIVIAEANLGNISNSEGKFEVNIPEAYSKSSITFSCIGYETRTIPIDSLNNGHNTVLLKEAMHTLNPLLITNISPREYIERSIKKIPENYIDYPVSFDGYYLSATKEDGKYCRLLETQVDVYSKNLLRYFQQSSDDSTHTVFEQDHRQYRIQEPSLFHHSLSFDHVINGKAFLNPENLDSWDFEFIGAFEGDNIILIQAGFIDPEQKIDHKASIYIDQRTLAILKIEYDYIWNAKHFIMSPGGSVSTAYHRWSGVFNYTKYSDRYFIKSFNYNVTQGVYDRASSDLIVLQEIRNELIINTLRKRSTNESSQLPRFAIQYRSLDRDNAADQDNRINAPIETEVYWQMKKDMEEWQ